jgi:hypothetical protein
MRRSTQTRAESSGHLAGQAAESVLMVRPAAFARNDVTRPTNRFQSEHAEADPGRTSAMALMQFDRFAATLRQRGVDVHVFEGRTTSQLPDEIFPNNWITMHPDGTAVLYPLMAWNRRRERRRDILELLQQQADGFRIDRLVDLSRLEAKSCFLEGTGSLALDHANRLAYVCLSPRTHVDALREFARKAEYDVITFNGQDHEGHAIYHTNVMMSLGERFAVVCLDAIPAVDERFRVLTRLERSGREVIEIALPQLRSFVGNLLQLRAGDKRLIVLSTQAHKSLTEMQIAALARHGELVPVEVSTIEANGGGSVRCMLAEIFLPRKTAPAGLAPAN